MTDKTTLEPVLDLQPAEPVYLVPAHPVAAAPLSEETVTLTKPVAATESLSNLVEQAMVGLRTELKAELSAEFSKQTGGLSDAKNQELSTG